jgi:hypothetical protein
VPVRLPVNVRGVPVSYEVSVWRFDGLESLEECLTDLYAKGWRLAALTESDGYYTVVAERETNTLRVPKPSQGETE